MFSIRKLFRFFPDVYLSFEYINWLIYIPVAFDCAFFLFHLIKNWFVNDDLLLITNKHMTFVCWWLDFLRNSIYNFSHRLPIDFFRKLSFIPLFITLSNRLDSDFPRTTSALGIWCTYPLDVALLKHRLYLLFDYFARWCMIDIHKWWSTQWYTCLS